MRRTEQTCRFWSQTPSSHPLCILELRTNSLVRTYKHKNTIHVIRSIHTTLTQQKPHSEALLAQCRHVHPSQHEPKGRKCDSAPEFSPTTSGCGGSQLCHSGCSVRLRPLCLHFGWRQATPPASRPSPGPCTEQGHPQFLSLSL